MKRSLICVLLVGCFCLGLCGCGAMDRTDNPVLETPLIPQATAELLPVPDVMETPDMEDGFVQELSSADEKYIPAFDLTGVRKRV